MKHFQSLHLCFPQCFYYLDTYQSLISAYTIVYHIHSQLRNLRLKVQVAYKRSLAKRSRILNQTHIFSLWIQVPFSYSKVFSQVIFCMDVTMRVYEINPYGVFQSTNKLAATEMPRRLQDGRPTKNRIIFWRVDPL